MYKQCQFIHLVFFDIMTLGERIMDNNINENRENLDLQTKAENKKANILCIISAALMYGINVIRALFYKKITAFLLENELENVNSLAGNIRGIANALACICPLIGFVLMIYIRVRYPKHIWGKVLMWFTIASIIMSVIYLTLLIIACNSCFGTVIGSCNG